MCIHWSDGNYITRCQSKQNLNEKAPLRPFLSTTISSFEYPSAKLKAVPQL